MTPESNKVTIYASSTCPQCKKVKQYMEENGIPYSYYELDKDSSKFADFKRDGGTMTVPLTVIEMNGNIMTVSGEFDEVQFDNIFNC